MKGICSKSVTCILALICIVFHDSCSSIVNEKQQKIKIAANVPNAKVYIDGEEKGLAPSEISLARSRKDYKLEIIAPGCEPYHSKLKSKLCPSFYGNILLGGGPIGMIADACTGRCWKYDDVSVALHPKGRDAANINQYHQHFTKGLNRDMVVISAQKKQPKVASQSDNTWANAAGTFAGVVTASLINSYLDPNGGNLASYPSSNDNMSGTGRKAKVHIPKKTCSYCGGSGRVPERGTNYGHGANYYMKSCPSCRGKGYKTGVAELY